MTHEFELLYRYMKPEFGGSIGTITLDDKSIELIKCKYGLDEITCFALINDGSIVPGGICIKEVKKCEN